MINRRKFFRCRIKGFKEATLILPAEQDRVYKVTLRNISGNGLSFVSREKFMISEFLTYTFKFNLEDEDFELKGCIVRKNGEEDRYTKYGVKLVPLSVKEESKLISVINRYQTKQYRDDLFSKD
ncbi:PilZ domain-containing protein [Alkalibacterium sp.]